MNPTFNKINEELSKYNNYFSENEFYLVQKAYTTPHFLVLLVRVPGKTLALYIGRGNQYIGIYVFDRPPPSFLRVQDKFLDYIRKYIVGSRIGKLKLNNFENSSVFQFQYKTTHIQNYFNLGYHERVLFFSKAENNLVFCSWNNQIVDSQDVVYPRFALEAYWGSVNIDEYLKAEEEKLTNVLEQKKRTKFLIRKLENIKKDLENSKEWFEIEKLLLNDQIDLSEKVVLCLGQKIKLPVTVNEWEKKDFLFKKIKKFKRGNRLLASRKIEVENEIEETGRGNFVKAIIKEKPIQICWKNEVTKKSNVEKSSNDFREFSIGNINGLLGLNSSGNDFIRNIAGKDFYWFHIDNYTGAHCILKTETLLDISAEMYSVIASFLRDYSQLTMLEIPVIYTQVKNIKGLKGKRGAVTVKKAKHITCYYKDWKEIITVN